MESYSLRYFVYLVTLVSAASPVRPPDARYEGFDKCMN